MNSVQPGSIKSAGYVALALGLIVVVMSRGCDSLAGRGAASAQANYTAAQTSFNREWSQKIEDAKADERMKLMEEQNKKRADLEKGEWRSLKNSADDARLAGSRWGYWYEWMFLVGSVLLVIGLLVLGARGVGAERIIALIMLAIITFSIYVGGLAWVSSIKNLMGG